MVGTQQRLPGISKQTRLDPTRTTLLRKAYMNAMAKRFKWFRDELWELIVTEDAFGLKDQTDRLVLNKRFSFGTNGAKEKQFQGWMKKQVREGILEVPEGEEFPEEPWMSTHITSAYKKGANKAYIDTRFDGQDKLGQYGDTKAGFLSDTFSAQQSTESLRRLYQRNFTELQDVTTTMDAKMSKILADGLAHGKSPREIATQMDNEIARLTKTRALTIARTEIIHAYAEGQLDSFEAMGHDKIGLMAEWDTADDGKVCKQCGKLEGVILTVKQARGLLPRHPNCRCAWIPYFDEPEYKEPGQKRTTAEVTQALEQSILAGWKKKIPLKTAKQRTTWPGADLKPAMPRRPRAKVNTKIADAVKKSNRRSKEDAYFGHKIGTSAEKLNELTFGEAKSVKQLVEATGLKESRVRAHIQAMLKKGKMVKEGNAYRFIDTTDLPPGGVVLPPVTVPVPKPKLPGAVVTKTGEVFPPEEVKPKAPVKYVGGDERGIPVSPPKPAASAVDAKTLWGKPGWDLYEYHEQHKTNDEAETALVNKFGYLIDNEGRVTQGRKLDLLNIIDKEAGAMSRFPKIKAYFEQEIKRANTHNLILREGKTFTNLSGNSNCYGTYNDDWNEMNMASGLSSRGLPAPKNGKGEWNVGDDFGTVFRHEFGHQYWYKGMTSAERLEWDKVARNYVVADKSKRTQYMTPAPAKKMFPVSRYASTNTKEVQAESFAAYTHPGYKRGSLPKDLEELLDKHLVGAPVNDTKK